MSYEKMTRKELAQEIYRLNKVLGFYNANSIAEKTFVNKCLKGCGVLKPQTKRELLSWYINLKARV